MLLYKWSLKKQYHATNEIKKTMSWYKSNKKKQSHGTNQINKKQSHGTNQKCHDLSISK